MWLCVDVAGRLSVTRLHSEEEVGHTHLGGEGGQGLSCVDTSHFTLLPDVSVCVFLSCAQREEDQNTRETP